MKSSEFRKKAAEARESRKKAAPTSKRHQSSSKKRTPSRRKETTTTPKVQNSSKVQIRIQFILSYHSAFSVIVLWCHPHSIHQFISVFILYGRTFHHFDEQDGSQDNYRLEENSVSSSSSNPENSNDDVTVQQNTDPEQRKKRTTKNNVCYLIFPPSSSISYIHYIEPIMLMKDSETVKFLRFIKLFAHHNGCWVRTITARTNAVLSDLQEPVKRKKKKVVISADVTPQERRQLDIQLRENLREFGVRDHEMAYYQAEIRAGTMDLFDVEADVKKARQTERRNKRHHKKSHNPPITSESD